MQLLSEMKVTGSATGAVIQLLQGDLTALPEEHKADILVVSAFPNDYTPLRGSLMYALCENGVDIGVLARDKAVDLVAQLGCWMSQPLSKAQQDRLNFSQILCFEPTRQSGSPETLVSNIFRCINNFAFDDNNNVIAMPVLASGWQRIPMSTMLPAMLEACVFWMDTGIPLDYVKLVLHDPAQIPAALVIFEHIRQKYQADHVEKEEPAVAARGIAPQAPPASSGPAPLLMTPSAPAVMPGAAAAGADTLEMADPGAPQVKIPVAPIDPGTTNFDFFISYSHVHTPQVTQLVSALKEKNGDLNIFYDRNSIPAGGHWIKVISEAIQRSRYVVCILSPEYRSSDVCWDEFQCAKAKEYRTKQSVIKTINFMKDEEMPLIMSLYSYIDCTEGDIGKLREAANQLCY